MESAHSFALTPSVLPIATTLIVCWECRLCGVGWGRYSNPWGEGDTLGAIVDRALDTAEDRAKAAAEAKAKAAEAKAKAAEAKVKAAEAKARAVPAEGKGAVASRDVPAETSVEDERAGDTKRYSYLP